MACGTPIASSNTAAMPEILGDAATYFDPENIEDIADKLGMLYQVTDDLIDEKNFNDRNKLSIVNFLGRSKTEQLAKSLSLECTKLLNPFGRKAEVLIKVPRFILERKY